MLIEAKARAEGKSEANYVRSKPGLPDRDADRATVTQLQIEQDQALEILREPLCYLQRPSRSLKQSMLELPPENHRLPAQLHLLLAGSRAASIHGFCSLARHQGSPPPE